MPRWVPVAAGWGHSVLGASYTGAEERGEGFTRGAFAGRLMTRSWPVDLMACREDGAEAEAAVGTHITRTRRFDKGIVGNQLALRQLYTFIDIYMESGLRRI